MDLEKIRAEIETKSNLSKEALDAKVRQKMEKFAGLLNEESALLMVGREFGVESSIPKTYHPISSLLANTFGVSVRASVRQMFAPRSFEKNGRLGQTMSLIIGDDSGNIRLTLWNDQVDEARQKGLRDTSILEIDFANVSEYRGQLQLQLAKNTPWRILPGNPVPLLPTPLNRLIPDTTVGVRATLLGIFPVKDFQTRDGRTNMRAGGIVFGDATTLRLVAWGEQALALQAFEPGDAVQIENALVKKGLQGENEIQLNAQSRMTLYENDSDDSWFEALSKDYPVVPLNTQPTGNIRIHGIIEKFNDRAGHFFVCPRCAQKIEKTTIDYACVRCGRIENPRKKAVLGIHVSDSTSSILVRLFGRTAEKLVHLSADEIEHALDDEKKQALLGKKIDIVGSARENAFRHENEIFGRAWRFHRD